jgi:acetyl esterase/lipase
MVADLLDSVTRVPPAPRQAAPWRRGDVAFPRRPRDTILVLVPTATGGRRHLRGWAEFYADYGYATFAIDYLGSGPNAPAPVYPAPEVDVKAAVQYLRQRAGGLGVNPDRIVVHGFGTGAALGAQALVTPDHSYFDSPSLYPGLSDAPAAFIGFYGRYDGYQSDPVRYYGGPAASSDPKVRERYVRANVIARAGDAAGAALLIQGLADESAVVNSAAQLHDALRAARKDVTLRLVPGAGACFDVEESGALTMTGRAAATIVLDWLATRFPPQ